MNLELDKPQVFDSHCHLQFPQYDRDREEMIKRTLKMGVKMICVGTDYEMSVEAVELAKKYDGIWASVGLCPSDNRHKELDFKKYKSLLAESKVVAVGEVGLDYYRTTDEELIVKQKDNFIKFLELARETDKPLILHCRDAYTDILEMLDAAATLFSGSAVRGVVHSFASNWEMAEKFIDKGFLIGLNGIITFPPSRPSSSEILEGHGKASEGQVRNSLDEVAKNIPLDKLLLETDAPYLAPVPHRGKRNEPSFVEFVAKKIANLRNENVERICEATKNNTKKLFNI